ERGRASVARSGRAMARAARDERRQGGPGERALARASDGQDQPSRDARMFLPQPSARAPLPRRGRRPRPSADARRTRVVRDGRRALSDRAPGTGEITRADDDGAAERPVAAGLRFPLRARHVADARRQDARARLRARDGSGRGRLLRARPLPQSDQQRAAVRGPKRRSLGDDAEVVPRLMGDPSFRAPAAQRARVGNRPGKYNYSLFLIGNGATKARPRSGSRLRNLISAKSPAICTAESAALSTRIRRKWCSSIPMKWHNTVRMISPWETKSTRPPSFCLSARVTASTPRAWTSGIVSPPGVGLWMGSSR